jgi:hypothetical protein
MRSTVTVHKLDDQGQEVWLYQGVVLERTSNSVKIEANYDRQDIDFFGLHLRRGDRFVETFYNDRWYNVFAIYDVEDNHFKGWYCNITRPARLEAEDVIAEDLALDLIVTPEGDTMVLDEDEFTSLEISAEERQRALETLGDLMAMAASKSGPFSKYLHNGD